MTQIFPCQDCHSMERFGAVLGGRIHHVSSSWFHKLVCLCLRWGHDRVRVAAHCSTRLSAFQVTKSWLCACSTRPVTNGFSPISNSTVCSHATFPFINWHQYQRGLISYFYRLRMHRMHKVALLCRKENGRAWLEYVVVQFYPRFKFYSYVSRYHTLSYPKTTENKG